MTRSLVRLPERSLAIALLLRGATVWFLVRLTVGVPWALGSQLPGRSVLKLTIPASILLVLLVGALGLLEARRRNEHRFLANLGVSPFMIVVLSMTPALLAEACLGIAGAP
jgi:hypothetical protein